MGRSCRMTSSEVKSCPNRHRFAIGAGTSGWTNSSASAWSRKPHVCARMSKLCRVDVAAVLGAYPPHDFVAQLLAAPHVYVAAHERVEPAVDQLDARFRAYAHVRVVVVDAVVVPLPVPIAQRADKQHSRLSELWVVRH